MKKHTRTLPLLLTLFLLILGTAFLWRTGFFQAATSLEGLQAYIQTFSPYTHLVFFLLQLVSVVLAPIPSNVTAMAGALLFGIWPAFLLTWAAVALGSALVFLLARRLGRPFADRFVSQKLSARYLELIHRKRDVFLTMAFLFPFFPDDILCILPGHRGPLPPLGPAGGLRRGRLDGGHSHLGHDPAGSGRSGTFPDGHEIRRPGGGGPSPPPGPEIMVQADGPGGNPAGTVCLSALDAGHFQPQPGSSISRPQPSPEPATLGGKNSWTGNLTWRKSSQGSSSPQEPQGHSFSGMQ